MENKVLIGQFQKVVSFQMNTLLSTFYRDMQLNKVIRLKKILQALSEPPYV
jgi:hypothetical protein